jgi:hypothetical protein
VREEGCRSGDGREAEAVQNDEGLTKTPPQRRRSRIRSEVIL